MKKRLGAVERLYPMPCPLVVGGTIENADTLAVAWINIVASTPPTVAMGLRESRRTLQLIEETRSFSVNIPPSSLAAEVDFCGITSGRQVDKFAATGLTLLPGAVTDTPIIEQCPFNLECRLTETVVVGSYRVVIGEIVEAHADEAVLVSPDSDLVDIGLLDPLVYAPGVREYWRLGEKVADAFSVGRTLDPDSAKESS
jgi:flavin reductase (DIM6/NTAB) family NADH-FMN oxidoreductase RutF